MRPTRQAQLDGLNVASQMLLERIIWWTSGGVGRDQMSAHSVAAQMTGIARNWSPRNRGVKLKLADDSVLRMLPLLVSGEI